MGTCKAVIFDLDGTLLNTLEDLRDSVNEILKRHGFPLRSLEQIRSYVGNGAGKLIQRALPSESPQEEVKRCLDEYLLYYAEHSRIKTRPYEGIPELLEELKNKGIRLAVVSNKGENTVKELCESYFPGYIAAAVGDLEGFKKKPEPDNINRAMKALAVEREAVIYVGDSDVDIETARNCNLKSVLVSWGFRGKEYLETCGAVNIIDKPEKLLYYL